MGYLGQHVILYVLNILYLVAHDRDESSRVESGNETSEDEMDAEEEEDALHYEMEEEEKKVSVVSDLKRFVFSCQLALVALCSLGIRKNMYHPLSLASGREGKRF